MFSKTHTRTSGKTGRGRALFAIEHGQGLLQGLLLDPAHQLAHLRHAVQHRHATVVRGLSEAGNNPFSSVRWLAFDLPYIIYILTDNDMAFDTSCDDLQTSTVNRKPSVCLLTAVNDRGGFSERGPSHYIALEHCTFEVHRSHRTFNGPTRPSKTDLEAFLPPGLPYASKKALSVSAEELPACVLKGRQSPEAETKYIFVVFTVSQPQNFRGRGVGAVQNNHTTGFSPDFYG